MRLRIGSWYRESMDISNRTIDLRLVLAVRSGSDASIPRGGLLESEYGDI